MEKLLLYRRTGALAVRSFASWKPVGNSAAQAVENTVLPSALIPDLFASSSLKIGT